MFSFFKNKYIYFKKILKKKGCKYNILAEKYCSKADGGTPRSALLARLK